MEHAGRTGGLPFVGVGWYRTEFEVPQFAEGKKASILFDGAMSHAKVYINFQFFSSRNSLRTCCAERLVSQPNNATKITKLNLFMRILNVFVVLSATKITKFATLSN